MARTPSKVNICIENPKRLHDLRPPLVYNVPDLESNSTLFDNYHICIDHINFENNSERTLCLKNTHNLFSKDSDGEKIEISGISIAFLLFSQSTWIVCLEMELPTTQSWFFMLRFHLIQIQSWLLVRMLFFNLISSFLCSKTFLKWRSIVVASWCIFITEVCKISVSRKITWTTAHVFCNKISLIEQITQNYGWPSKQTHMKHVIQHKLSTIRFETALEFKSREV